MQRDVFGLIYAGEEYPRLGELTSVRNVAALPVAGRYRAIDFVLSNMVNSNIRNIGVLTRRNYQSLMDHLDAGKDWDLSRKRDGLFILPPYDTVENSVVGESAVDSLVGAAAYLRRVPQEYCLFARPSLIYNTTYNEMYKQHIKTGADITIMYTERKPGDDPNTTYYSNLAMELDDNSKVKAARFCTNPAEPGFIGMEAMLIKKDLLRYLLDNAVARNKHNLVQDVILENINRLNIYGFKYDGFVAKLDNIAGYFKTNMNLLNAEAQKDLFFKDSSIYTKTKDGAPAKYGANAVVKNSLIASGCVIEGNVENCVLFRGVYVAPGVTLKNCVVMQDSQIYEKASLNNVILDKNVSIRPGSVLAGSEMYPVIIPKGAIA